MADVTYEVTDEPNIIRARKVINEEIHIDKLKKQIEDLKKQIEAIPDPVAYPENASDEVKKAIDFYNEMNASIDKSELEAELKEKQNLLKRLLSLR